VRAQGETKKVALDVVDLREFYVSSLGRLVRDVLRRHVSGLWPSGPLGRGEDERLLAVGFGTPYLRPLMECGWQVMAMMPPELGVVFWPREGPNRACMADLSHLPLPDACVDRAVVVHALELAADPDALLDEVWRVLKPNGRMVVMVPYRRGLWAFSEATPFGYGRPYSSAQLRNLLKDHDFVLEYKTKAFLLPPLFSRLGVWVSSWVEAVLAPVLSAFGGVLVVEAVKQLYTPAMVKRKPVSRRILLPMPFPTSALPSNRSTKA